MMRASGRRGIGAAGSAGSAGTSRTQGGRGGAAGGASASSAGSAASSADDKEGAKATKKAAVRFHSCYQNTVLDVFNARKGFVSTDNALEWDITWADKEWMNNVFDRLHLAEHQRVNHFRNHFELTRKDNLAKNIKRTKRQLEREDNQETAKYDILPASFMLPSEYSMFVEEFKRHQTGTFWIMKPVGKAQGKGIFLFSKLSQIAEWKKDYRWSSEGPQAEAYVVQRYLANPYLVGGKKFDLRIYVLVSSYYPMRVYLHRLGFARFSNHRYSMNMKDMTNNFVHLTNVAIQKTSDEYHAAGSKWSLHSLRLYMISRHGADAVNKLFNGMQSVILRSLESVQKVMMNDRHCFEVYGYDIIIDADLRPWLLEVNAAPSLSATDTEDHETKFTVVNDTLSVIMGDEGDVHAAPASMEEPVERVGGYDLIKDQATDFESTSCNLGCHCDTAVISAAATEAQMKRVRAAAMAAAAAREAEQEQQQELVVQQQRGTFGGRR
jgi:tubulin polyglutamylase TTLL9